MPIYFVQCTEESNIEVGLVCMLASTNVIFKDNFLTFYKVQFSFSGSTILFKSSSNSFDLRPVSSTKVILYNNF
jgi:hypothetical protein